VPKVSAAHSAARRRQIIDAAYRCFARKGFHQTSMRDIYEEANLSPGAVYHYFDSKDSIIRASFEFDLQRGRDHFAAAVSSDDPAQALLDLIDVFFHGLERAAALGAGRVNVQGWGEALVNPPLLDTMRGVLDHSLDALMHVVQKAQAAGQIDPSIDARSVGRALLSLYYGLELQKALDPEIDIAPYVAAIKALLFANPPELHTDD
jgi:AcrR family transcriptional regulator